MMSANQNPLSANQLNPKNMPGFPSLCRTFRHLEWWAWNKIDSANKCGVSFGEETITESLLLKLAEWHPNQLSIRAYTKIEEGVGTAATGGLATGADWSFWVVDQQGKGIELRIQAKRQFISGRYQNLEGFGQQIVDLWNNCNGAIPLFVFYNGPFNTNSAGNIWSNFSCGSKCAPGFQGQDCWGCSFAGVFDIPPKSKPYPIEISNMRPWHCLVCECQCSQGGFISLPQKLCSIANSIYGAGVPRLDSSFRAVNEVFEPHNSAPEWASWLDRDESKEQAVDSPWSRFWNETDLKGVAVIKQLPIESPNS